MERDYTNVRRKTTVDLGRNVFLTGEAKITVPEFRVGDNTRINGPIMVRGREDCHIGKYCALGYNITIITTNHDVSRPNLQVNMHRQYGFRSLEISRGPVTIGHNVWVGDNSTILSGVTVGHGAVVGAGAVVTKDLPPFSVAAGVPAKVGRMRFSDDMIEWLLDIKWWDWPEDRIARNRGFFETDLTHGRIEDVKKTIVV